MLEDNPSFEYVDPGPDSKRSWGNFRMYSYILVRNGTDIKTLKSKAETLVNGMDLLPVTENARLELVFHKISKIHLHSDFPDEIKAPSSMYLIYMRLLIATIVLLICLLNFINLFINDFVERTKDLAIREIFGAERRKLYMLVLQKSFIISFLAGIIACCILLLSGRILVVPNPQIGRASCRERVCVGV